MQLLESLLKRLGFADPRPTQGHKTIEHLFPDHQKRGGIYVLHLADDHGYETHYYVGQTSDITRRYQEHLPHYPPILRLSFQREGKNTRKQREKMMIEALDKHGVQLLNKVHTSIPYHSSDFDLLMPPYRQEQWLTDRSWVDLTGSRRSHTKLRDKGTARYQRFQRQPYASTVPPIIGAYLKAGIPRILQGEAEYWNCSCLANSEPKAISRVNINRQEVFAIYPPHDDNVLEFAFWLARSPLEAAYGSDLSGLTKPYPNLKVCGKGHDVGCHDQVHLYVTGIPTTCDLLQDPSVVSALRLLNLCLMKQGKSPYNRAHCVPLMDHILQQLSTENQES